MPLATDLTSQAGDTARLVKSVANGTTGGAAVPTDCWTCRRPVALPRSAPTAGDTGIVDVAVGSYDLAESAGPDGYTAGDWSCVNGTEAPVTGDQVTVELGDAWVCTITNTADQPTLRLIKSVDNGNTGGTAGRPTGTCRRPVALPWSARPPVTPASSTSPSAATTWRNPPGRTATPPATGSRVNGTEAPVTGDQVTVELGDAWVCTITNTADQATLQLIKVVDNGTSGQTAPPDWNLSATGPTAGTADRRVAPRCCQCRRVSTRWPRRPRDAHVSGYVPGPGAASTRAELRSPARR